MLIILNGATADKLSFLITMSFVLSIFGALFISRKIDFIDQRITSVKVDLEKSEQLIKIFNEQSFQ